MENIWLNKDDIIDLPKLFEHFGYSSVIEEKNHIIFRRKNLFRIVIYTAKGFLYYSGEKPMEKFSASSLIIDEVSRIEGNKKETLWDKVNEYYNKVVNSKDFILNESNNKFLVKVASDYNHFLSYTFPLNTQQSDLYSNLSQYDCFQNRIFENKTGDPIYPLYNEDKEVTGYFIDSKDVVEIFRESDKKHSLWHSNIPNSTEWIVLFNNPKEAVAFHKKFELKNAIYLAMGEINYQTTKVLFNLQKVTKAKQIVLSLTGSKKIEGYLRDLNFISFIDVSNFNLKLRDNEINIKIKKGEEKSRESRAFVRFYNNIKDFNQGLTQSFIKYNKVMNQELLNKHQITIKSDGDDYLIRVPLEISAIKVFVWAYYKNYLNKSIEILKPKQNNWALEWEASQSLALNGKEEKLEDYKIAL